MAGARNFAHFAAESTLDLLSRRRIQMWFVTDRDEITDAEINRMIERLRGRAKLEVLPKRELENYLLDPAAISALIEEKQKFGGMNGPRATPEEVMRALQDDAISLRDEIVRLRLESQLLMLFFFRTRTNPGTVEERIRGGITALQDRLENISNLKSNIEQEVDQSLATRALDHVPGTRLLESVAKRFGVSFSKDKGDGERLARYLSISSINQDIIRLLREITREETP